MSPSARPAPDVPARNLTAGLVLAVALPVMVAGLRVAAGGWNPTIDDATIVTRSYDVLSTRSPLLGQFSIAAKTGTTPAHSPGPMLYWLLSIPARFGPSWLLPVFIAAVNTVLIGAVVILARRRAGLTFAAFTAIGIILLVRSIGPVVLTEVWNPWAALMPFLLMMFLTWSIADGERRLLPWLVLVASFAMQAHLTYAMPTVALGLVALAGGWGPQLRQAVTGPRSTLRALRAERADGAGDVVDAPAEAEPVRRRLPGPLVLAVLVGLACWAAPLVQQFTGHPGNLSVVLDAGSNATRRGGLKAVRASFARSVGTPPRWMRPSRLPIHDILEGLNPHGLLGLLTGLIVVALLVVIVLLAVRRRDRVVIAGGATAFALLIGMAGVAFTLPLDRGLVVGYAFEWFRIAGLFVWLLVGLGIGRAWLATRPERARSASTVGSVAAHPELAAVRPITVGLLGVSGLAVVAVGLMLPLHDPSAWTYAPGHKLDAVVDAGTRPGGRYLVGPNAYDVAFSPAVVWRLRTTGRYPYVSEQKVAAWGDGYRPTGRRCAGIVTLLKPDEPLPRGGRSLADIAIPNGPELPPSMRVVLAPDPGRSC